MADQTATLLRELPSIDRLLNHARCAALLIRYNRDYVTQKFRAALDQLRANIRQGKGQLLNDDAILDQVEAQIEMESRPGHIRVVNATGTILHTNLGRALLSRAAIDAVIDMAGGADDERHKPDFRFWIADFRLGRLGGASILDFGVSEQN